MPTRDRILAVLCGHEAGRIRFTFPSGGGNLRLNYAASLRVVQAIGCSHVHVSVTNTLPPGFGKSLKFGGPFSHGFVRTTEHAPKEDRSMFLRGGLDEAAIYPRCLTADEIRKNYRTATGAGAKG